MFIATSQLNDPRSVGAKCDSLDNISLLRSLPKLILASTFYKHWVPTGLTPFSRKLFVTMGQEQQNAEEHHYAKQAWKRIVSPFNTSQRYSVNRPHRSEPKKAQLLRK